MKKTLIFTFAGIVVLGIIAYSIFFFCFDVTPNVYYVPGWKAKSDISFISAKVIKSIFGTSKITVVEWHSDGNWNTSKENAEKTAKEFASKIAVLPEKKQRECTLVGHSLGGRIVARTAKILAMQNIKVKKVILLGAAINCDDPDLKFCGEISEEPFINVFNLGDNVLKLAYGNIERALPAGYCGVKQKYPNMKQYRKHSYVDNDMANIFEHHVDVYFGFLQKIKQNKVPEYISKINHHEIKFEPTFLSLPPNVYLTAPGANIEATYHEWKLCYYNLCDINLPQIVGGKKVLRLYLIVGPYGEVMWNINYRLIRKRWNDIKQQINTQLAAAQKKQ